MAKDKCEKILSYFKELNGLFKKFALELEKSLKSRDFNQVQSYKNLIASSIDKMNKKLFMPKKDKDFFKRLAHNIHRKETRFINDDEIKKLIIKSARKYGIRLNKIRISDKTTSISGNLLSITYEADIEDKWTKYFTFWLKSGYVSSIQPGDDQYPMKHNKTKIKSYEINEERNQERNEKDEFVFEMENGRRRHNANT